MSSVLCLGAVRSRFRFRRAFPRRAFAVPRYRIPGRGGSSGTGGYSYLALCETLLCVWHILDCGLCDTIL